MAVISQKRFSFSEETKNIYIFDGDIYKLQSSQKMNEVEKKRKKSYLFQCKLKNTIVCYCQENLLLQQPNIGRFIMIE
jgi:hypothetical protein